MEELSEKVRCTVTLMTRNDGHVAIVESIEALTPLRVVSRQGAIMPAHCVSGGKVLLALLTDDEIVALYPDQALRQMTDQTIRTRDELIAQIRAVRERGYAVDFNESGYGISAVAVAVPNKTRENHVALVVSAPSAVLIPQKVQAMVGELHQTASLMDDAYGL